MSNELQGMVRAVVTTQAGGVGLTWTGNTLVVDDAHAFPRDGGQFKIEGYETAFSYVSVADGETEDDPDTITTVETAPGALTSQFRLDLWPAAVSSVAEVAMPEALDDTVPAIIPHSLKAFLVDGVRDPEDQESVLIAQRDMSWYVVDILGQSEVRIPDVVAVVDDAKAEAMEAHTMASQATQDAQNAHNTAVEAQDAAADATAAAGAATAAADAAAQDAANAAGIAGGKADVLIQPGAPAAAYQAATTLWIDTTDGNNTPKRWDGSKWVVVTDKAATDAAAQAAAAQTTASNAATAAGAAQTAADNAQAAAEAAQTAAGDAQTMATNALTSANGRNSRIVSTGDPGGTTNPRTGLAWVEGDTWWKWDNTTARNVIGAWAYRNGDWVAEKIGHQTIASVDVNKLVVSGSANIDQAVINKLVGNIALFDAFVGKTFTGGTFSGSDFYAPGIEAVPRIHVGETPTGKPIIELIRGDGAEEWRTVSIGGSDSDELMLYDAAGNPMSGFSGEGDGTVRRNLTVGGLAEVGGLTVDGDDIHAIIDRKPRGLIASAYGWLNIPSVGSAEAGLIRFPVLRFEPDRIYRIRFEVVATADTPTDNLYLSIRNQSGGNATVASNLLYGQALPAGSIQAHTIEYIWNGTYGDVRNDSLLFTARNSTANRRIQLEMGRKRTLATIEDLGTRAGNVGGVVTLAGGTAWTGYTPPPVVEPVQTYVKTYAAMETKVFYGSGTTSDGNLHHGTFSGITRYSWIRFNPQVKADTSGATVKKVEVKLRNTHTWNGSVGTFKIGTTTREATPTAVSHIIPSTPVTVNWAHGAAAWVNITGAGWHSTMIAVVLGEGASGNTQYGKFSATLADIQLRVTYEK